MLTRKSIAIVAATIVTAMSLTFIAIAYLRSPYRIQRRNRALAEKFINEIQPGLVSQPRFRQVDFSENTANEPFYVVIWVYGRVESDEDGKLLRNLIEANKPPVPVTYRVAAGTEQPSLTVPAGLYQQSQ